MAGELAAAKGRDVSKGLYMKNRLNRHNLIRSKSITVLFVMLALIFALSFTTAVYADSSVSYEGDAQDFVFTPGSSESPTDLFPGFKRIMPGDTLTDSVEVKNNTDKTVNIYLRALGANEGSEAFLSQMTLKVDTKDGSTLFEAPADRQANLEDWVLLGSFAPKASVTLDITLDVPITMGDEFENAEGRLQWQFKAEEIEVTPTPTPEPEQTAKKTDARSNAAGGTTAKTKGADTGDNTDVFVWGVVLACAAVILSGAIAKKRSF